MAIAEIGASRRSPQWPLSRLVYMTSKNGADFGLFGAAAAKNAKVEVS